MYNYTGKVYLYNITLESCANYQVKLILDENNFNFDLAQDDGFDFRLAERSNGSGIFKMWVAKWDKDNKYAVLWFKIPYLSPDPKSTFYAFWGGPYSVDVSTPEELGFLFYEDFKSIPLDQTKWKGIVSSGCTGYGYLFPNLFTTITNALYGKNSFIMEAGVYLTEDVSCDLSDRAHGFEFISDLFGFGPTTLNPDDRSSFITLTNNNLSAQCSSTSERGVRSTTYRAFGKWYFEVLVTGGSYGTYIGIATVMCNLSYGIRTVGGYGYGYNGCTCCDGTVSIGFDTYHIDDVIGVSVDLDNGKLWWSKNGVWQGGGDPSLGTGERYSGVSGIFYAVVATTIHEPTVLTINFGSTELVYVPPSGFAQWVDGEQILDPQHIDENDFIINIMHESRVEHNAIDPGGTTYQSIDQIYGGLEQGSYQEHYIAYYEPEDRVYQRISNRNSYADIENKIDRKVEGDTRPSNVRLHGRQGNGAYPSYISWFVIREYDESGLADLDGSELYIPYENIEHQIFDYKEYTDDLTSIIYQHDSSFGGSPYNLSNDLCSSENDVWKSDEGATSSDPIYITIYFDRTENLVSTRKLHYDSGHEKFYNASKMSDSDIDVHTRDHWRGYDTSGWAVINFGTDRPIINVFGIKAVFDDLDSCPKNYKFYGGLESYTGPFKLLYEDVFEKTAEWQSITFTNKNPYKYYKFEIIDTYGNDIKVQEWLMYSCVGTDKPKYISQVRLLPADFGGLEDNFPKEISLEGSNDMLNWETVMPWTDTYTPYISHNALYGKWQRYSFTNIKGYWHYRLACRDNWGAFDGRIIICGWELCELVEEENIYRILSGETNNIQQIWASDTCGFEDSYGLIYVGNEKLNIVQRSKLVEEKDISEFYDDINVV